MVCLSVSFASRRARGQLIHQTIAGEANQRPSIGPDTAKTAGPEIMRKITAAVAITGAIHIVRQEAARPVLLLRPVSFDGFHSSSRLRVVRVRHIVRTLASSEKNAS